MTMSLFQETSPVRRRVMLFLAFLNSRDCQNTCARFMPGEKLAYELCRLWFDQIYTPGTRYLDGFKGDRSADDIRRFQVCFTSTEREALERFNRFLELRIEMLPESAKNEGTFPASDSWESIMKDAGHVLEDCGADRQVLQRQLGWIVRLAVKTGHT